MMKVKAINIAKWLVRDAFRAIGIELASTARFGLDPWQDIQHLARDWDRLVETVLDVGANRGDTTALLLKRFPLGRVVSFEPQARMAEKIDSTFRNQPRVHVENLALTNHEGTVEFYEYPNDKIASMTPNAPYAVRFGEQPKATSVRCTTLDRYCASNRIEHIDILKIDTEGNDHLVLQGASDMIAAGKIGFVYVEFNSIDPIEGQFGGALALANRILQPAGYRLVATYSDYIITETPMFSVSNALFALPPST